MRFLCTVLILSLVLVASRASAQTNPEFDFVLVPVFTADSPGAFGSLWRTELALFNSGDGPVAVRPLECLFPCGGHVTYAAGTGDRLTPFTYTARPGRLLWVEKSRVSDVRFSLRIDVEPVTTGMRLWAFVSITNNTTQEFTTVTPQ